MSKRISKRIVVFRSFEQDSWSCIIDGMSADDILTLLDDIADFVFSKEADLQMLPEAFVQLMETLKQE